ncbi:MAG: NFACT RNA binding domain-containing protein [Parachlamydiales bacterium]
MLSFSEMHALCKEVGPILSRARLARVRELGEKKWSFQFEQEGKQTALLICAQVPFSRFHLSSEQSIGKQTAFTHVLEERLLGSVFEKIEMLNDDRVVAITLDKNGAKFLFIAELCFKHPKIVLASASLQVLESWEQIPDKQYRLPSSAQKQSLEPAAVDSLSIEKRYRELEQKTRFEEKKRWVAAQLEKRKKKAEQRLKLHHVEKDEAEKWHEQAHLGELLQSHFYLLKRGMHSIIVEDWEQSGEKREIPLDPSLEPQEMVKQFFKQSRKLKKKREVIDILIQKVQAEIDGLNVFLSRLKEAAAIEMLDILAEEARLMEQKPKPQQKKEEKRYPFREFITEAGLHIFVGRSDEDNDRLSFTFAHGNDRWFHAENTPGSHVVLKVPKDGVVDEESLQDALQLALHFSKAKERGDDEVLMTECKFLSKRKGSKAGQVNVSKHKVVRVRLDPKRIQRLLGKIC